MIPSRPLDFGGVLTEAFRICKKIFGYSALITLLTLAPGSYIMIAGFNSLLDSFEGIAKSYDVTSPQEMRFVHDYIVTTLHNTNNSILYRLQYPDEYKIFDSVYDALVAEQPIESLDSSFKAHFDSLATAITAEHPTPKGDYIWSEIVWPISLITIGLFVFLIGALVQTSVLYDLSCRVFEERQMTLGRAVLEGVRRNAWLLLVEYLAIGSAMLLGLGLLVGLTSAISVALGILGFLAALLLIAYSSFRVFFSSVALVSESLGPIAAIKRSLELTNGSFWRVFGIVFLGVIVITIISTIIQLPIRMLSAPNTDWLLSYLRGTNLSITAFVEGIKSTIMTIVPWTIISMGITAAFMPAFVTSFYYDLRTRLEGPLDYDAPASESTALSDSNPSGIIPA